MSPIFALEALPTPDVLSSTATHRFGSAPVFSAASRYTLGSGLNLGGSKSLSPEWIASGGKYASKSHATTETGTRGFPLVVAMENGVFAARSDARVCGTPGQGTARTASASTVSSFCKVKRSLPSFRVSARGGRPDSARAASTTLSTSDCSDAPDRTSSMGGIPAFARSSSTTSTMNSNALPAFVRTKSSRAATVSDSAVASGKYGASSQNATRMAGVSVSPSVPSKSKSTATARSSTAAGMAARERAAGTRGDERRLEARRAGTAAGTDVQRRAASIFARESVSWHRVGVREILMQLNV